MTRPSSTSASAEHIGPGIIRDAHLQDVVFPGQSNHYGTLFGGEALALMDKTAFIAASRYTRRTVVTARSERIDFHVAVRQGQLVETTGRVTAVGRTSVTVDVDLVAEDFLTGERQLATRGRFVLVALDEHGTPTPVPPLTEPAAGTETAR